MSKKLVIPLLFFGLLFVSDSRVFAYDNKTTHPALTQEIVDFNGSLTTEQKEWVIQGSIDEDIDPRYANHFYDPIYQVGWTGAGAGSGTTLASIIAKGLNVDSAVSWVNDFTLQESYLGGDRTWKRALEYFADGNEKEAYTTLGYVLHLLEDMSVPDHTRDDTHVQGVSALTGDDGSPYEQYAVNYNRGNIKGLGIADELKKEGAQAISKSSIQDYLISMAQYSNKYFFSKDTINNPKYSNPKIVSEEDGLGYGLDENGKTFPLVGIVNNKNDRLTTTKIYNISPRNNSILDAYFTHLSRQSILYGAGVISLFQKQAADAIINKDYPTHLVKYDFSPITSPVNSFIGVVQSSMAQEGQFLGNVLGGVGNFFSGLFNFSGNLKPAGEFTIDNQSQVISSDYTNEKNSAITRNDAVSRSNNINSESDSAGNIQQQEDSPALASKKTASQPEIVREGKSTSSVKTTDIKIASQTQTSSSGRGVSIVLKQCSFSSTQSAMRQGTIINEVAWMGTQKSANDEWVELKNISSQDINLNGWQLLGKGEDIKIIFGKDDKITANGFYILERTDDATLLGITANKIYSGALSNSDDGLRFFDPQCNLVDEVVASPSWPAGDSANRKTMERDGYGFGWHTSAEVGGTPSRNNSEPIIPGGGGNVSVNQSVDTEAASTSGENNSPSSNVSHVLISEIQVGTDADTEDEFIELYNPTDNAINLSGWELRKKTSSGTESNLIDNGAFNGFVPAKGFFLIANHSYLGSVVPDLFYSVSSTGVAYSNNSIILYDGDHSTASVIDEISYASIEKGQSLERKAWSNNCVSAQSDGEFLGNGCDTDSVEDFETRLTPHPQNYQNLPEPRSAPAAIKNFTVTYSSSSMELVFNLGATTSAATTTYEISEYSGTSTLFLTTSTKPIYSEKIKEIGRDYIFLAWALDAEGMSSQITSTTISIPSFLGSAYFYRNFPTSTDYYIETYHNGYPFVPNLYGWSLDKKWEIVVFYFDTDAKEDDLIEENGPSSLVPHDLVGVLPTKCLTCGDSEYHDSLVFPENYSSCGSGIAVQRAAMDYGKASEDNHLLFQISPPSGFTPSSTNYFTVAYYSTYDAAPLSRGYGFKLVALDKRKVYLSDSAPSHNSPTLSGEIVSTFNEDTSQISLSWPTSTDSDTLDRKLGYQVRYSSSSDWLSVSSNSANKTVSPGDSLEIQVRVLDDQGNYSDSLLSKKWLYPTTTFYISQISANNWSANFGEKDQNSLSGWDSAILQSIMPDSDFRFDRIVLHLWHSKPGDPTNLRLRIFKDNGSARPDIANQLGESILSVYSDPDPSTDITFRFNQSINLSASSTYWLILDVSDYIWASGWGAGFMNNAWRVSINSGTDAYALGVAGHITNNASATYDNSNFQIPNPDATSDWYMKIGLMEK